jgi:hypothetical protein
MIRKTAGEQVASMRNRVSKLEGIVEEHDKSFEFVSGQLEKLRHDVEYLVQQLRTLKESVGGDMSYTIRMLDDVSVEDYKFETLDDVAAVNVAEVSTPTEIVHLDIVDSEGGCIVRDGWNDHPEVNHMDIDKKIPVYLDDNFDKIAGP